MTSPPLNPTNGNGNGNGNGISADEGAPAVAQRFTRMLRRRWLIILDRVARQLGLDDELAR